MIVVLTGAGISQESGIPTFRASDGLWEQEKVEDVATPGGFQRNPKKVFDFYNARRRHLLSAAVAPNPAHFALAQLEAKYPRPVVIITQNIDNLHERGGSRNVLHMHGELLKARCTACHAIEEFETDFDASTPCPVCKKIGHLRPHIVWFEEMPLYLEAINDALCACKTFVSIGTSGNVYPAAGFASVARSQGARVIELNMEPSKGASVFHEGQYGPAGTIVPQWVETVLKS